MYISSTFDPTSSSSGTFNTSLPLGGKFLLANQSGVNLNLTFSDGSVGYAPAWQITPFYISTRNPNVEWTQQSILAGNTNPISQATVQCFLATENFLGTYPVSIQHTSFVGNNVSTNATVNTLSNEGNVVDTEVVDIGTTNNSRLVDIFNNKFTWKIEQSGVAHTVLQGRTTGKPLALGQTGDHVEVLGTIDVDQNLFVVGSTQLDNGNLTTDGSGHLILKNATSLQAKNASGTAKSILRVDASNNLVLQQADNNTLNILKSDGSTLASLDGLANLSTTGIIAQVLQSNPTAVHLAGITSGTADMYQFLQGTVKALVVFFNNYRNSTVNEQKLAIPTPFTTWSFFWTGATPLMHIYSGGSQLNSCFIIVQSLPSGGGSGGISVQSALNGYSYGEISYQFDSIGCGISMSQAQTGICVIVGL